MPDNCGYLSIHTPPCKKKLLRYFETHRNLLYSAWNQERGGNFYINVSDTFINKIMYTFYKFKFLQGLCFFFYQACIAFEI